MGVTFIIPRATILAALLLASSSALAEPMTTFTVHVEGEGAVSVVVSGAPAEPDAGDRYAIPLGAEVQLEALRTEDGGHIFRQWRAEAGSPAQPHTRTLALKATQPLHYTAVFDLGHALTVDGTIAKTVSVLPEAGQAIDKRDGNTYIVWGAGPVTIQVEGIAPEEIDRVTSHSYFPTRWLKRNGWMDAGYRFRRWWNDTTDEVAATSPAATIELEGAQPPGPTAPVYRAQYWDPEGLVVGGSKEPYHLAITIEGYGQTDPPEGIHFFKKSDNDVFGGEVTIRSISVVNSVFERWIINGDTETDWFFVRVPTDQDVEAVAIFEERAHLRIYSEHGYVTPGEGHWEVGEPVHLYADPEPGWKASRWIVDDGRTQQTFEAKEQEYVVFVLERDTVATVEYEAVPITEEEEVPAKPDRSCSGTTHLFRATATGDGFGTITPQSGRRYCTDETESYVIVATPYPGSRFVRWHNLPEARDIDPRKLSNTLPNTSDVDVQAEFERVGE